MSALSYLAHGATLSLAWFVAVNVAVSAAVLGAVAAFGSTRTARPAGFWFALRVLPASAAAVFVLAIFVPSYWEYEPRNFMEGFDVTLGAIAAIGVAVMGAAIVRAACAWHSASERTQAWLRHARPFAIDGLAIPAYAVDAGQPLVALVGVYRPRLFVTRGLLDALTPAELAATIAHELGHLHAFDNFKRLAMCAAPDVLSPLGAARTMEQRWAAAAERRADRTAVRDDTAARCALASALVKVARLTPAAVPVVEPISTLISGGEIASRVHELLDDRARPAESATVAIRWAAAALCALALATAYAPLLRSVHEATEVVVHTLP